MPSKLKAFLMFGAALPFVIFMAAVNILHPFFHFFEGGSLDAIIDYMTATAAQIASTLTHNHE